MQYIFIPDIHKNSFEKMKITNYIHYLASTKAPT